MQQLVAPTDLRIDFKPSPKQYELWKMLQPDYCPHCGGGVEYKKIGVDVNGNDRFKPACNKCGSFDLPQIVLGGGAAGGGKSYVGSSWIISSCMRYENLRAIVARKTIKSLKESTFNTIRSIMKDWGLKEGENFKINNLEGIVTFWNESTISLRELEDLPSDTNFERLGSSEWTIGFVDEVSEISERAIEILFSRLRWKTYDTFRVPRLLLTTNPTTNWVRDRFVCDQDGNPVKCNEGEAYVPFSVFDNPDEKFRQNYEASLNRMTDRAAKERLLYGNWMYTESNVSAVYHSFDGDKHLVDNLKEKVYNPLKPLVLSFDFNVLPYMSCLAFQFDYDEKKVYVLEEILGKPEDKTNNTPMFARKIKEKLLAERHLGGLQITGDSAGMQHSTLVMNGNNNYTLLQTELESGNLRPHRKLFNKQPAQVSRVDFINQLFEGYDGWEILIDMRCRQFIVDLTYQKRNPDGTKEKKKYMDHRYNTKVEKYGHLSDAFDYAICMFCSEAWKAFNQQSRPQIFSVKSSPYDMFDY